MRFHQTEIKKGPESPLISVGVIRLELTTPCTPCKYASQLRHTPIEWCKFKKNIILLNEAPFLLMFRIRFEIQEQCYLIGNSNCR